MITDWPKHSGFQSLVRENSLRSRRQVLVSETPVLTVPMDNCFRIIARIWSVFKFKDKSTSLLRKQREYVKTVISRSLLFLLRNLFEQLKI